MKHVLVIGSGGMLGGEAVGYFNGLGFWAQGVSHDERGIEGLIESGKFEWCVNCAALTDTRGIQGRIDMQSKSEDANVKFPAKLAEWCHIGGVSLIHYSTDYVFGEEERHTPIMDWEKPCPTCVYGKHKLQGENEALRLNPNKTAILRTSWLYGERNEKSFVHRVSKALVQSLSQGVPLEVNPSEWSMPTSTTALLGMTRAIIDNAWHGIFHAVSTTNGEVPSRQDWARTIGDMLKRDWERRHSLGRSTKSEDCVWERYDAGSIIDGNVGAEKWRPMYSAMMVSNRLRDYTSDWTLQLQEFIDRNGPSLGL